MSQSRTDYQSQEDFTWQPYRIKPLAAWAMRMNSDFECTSLEGTLSGRAGDWMVRADDGWTFPVANEIFRRYYTKREWRKPNEATQKERDPKGHEATENVHASDGHQR